MPHNIIHQETRLHAGVTRVENVNSRAPIFHTVYFYELQES